MKKVKNVILIFEKRSNHKRLVFSNHEKELAATVTWTKNGNISLRTKNEALLY